MIKFTFQTEADYNQARFTGYIDTYDIARVKVYHSPDSTGYSDFPVHSQEELNQTIARLQANGQKFEVYQHKHFYDISDYD